VVVLPRDRARLIIGFCLAAVVYRPFVGFINTITLRAGMAPATAVVPGPDSLPVMSVASPYIDICKFGSKSVQREPQRKADQRR
jgi:hypothetical protein